TKGFLPKTQDPLPYTAPIDLEALGESRKEEAFAQELAYAFQKERIDLYTIFLYFDKEKRKCLWLKIINDSYRSEPILRNYLQKLLSNLTPENVYQIVISVESEGILSHSYVFKFQDLEKYEKKEISSKELEVLSPMLEPIFPPGEFESKLLYIRHKKICLFNLKPSLHTYFGSTKGKLKYDVGFLFGPEGYLFDSIYYELKASYIVKSTNRDVGDKDVNNPSQLLNVRTDSINYWQTNTLHVERGYVQKTFNLDKSWFLRGSMGYFEIAYGGVAMEALYYPVNSLWAIGVEGSTLLKRKYSGLSFQSKVRKWEVDTPVFEHYVGLQYFLDFYFDVPIVKLNFKTSVGQFLAKDKGIRFDMMRYFKSGLRVGFWYTFTSGHDKVNGKTYFDKGFSISMPLDFFMAKSSRTRMFYEMSAWLRDVGAKAYTGKEIYPILHEERLE
ncbi:MAG: YjbH domain-containing protein, partial [Chlamydiae bacterium]|nr:YjbH domain-containing protein [Chlamydiota bacterium]